MKIYFISRLVCSSCVVGLFTFSIAHANREPASYRPLPDDKNTPAPSAASKIMNSNDSAPFQEEEDYGLSGNWGGTRKNLTDKGVDIAFIYKSDSTQIVSGGNKRTSTYLQNLDVKFLIDAEKLAGWKGTSFFISGLGNWGGSSGRVTSRYVGDSQVTSNIETPVDNFKLFGAWVQQKFADDNASILFGVHDLNSEFYVTDSSGLFLNSSFGVGKELAQTGTLGPSIYPYTTMTLRLRVNPSDNFYVQSGIFNASAGDPSKPRESRFNFSKDDGFLLITEAAFVDTQRLASKYGIGYWTYTRTFDHRTELVANTEPSQVCSSGAYLILDHSFTTSTSAFLRWGAASVDSNIVKENLSSGVVFRGLFESRPEDKLGLAFTQAEPSWGSTSEVAYEFSYRMELTKGLALQPDLQLVQNPGFSSEADDALVATLRLEIGL